METNMKEKFGHVRIADVVIASIAGLAASDVKGVAHLSGGLKREDVTRATAAELQRCIRVTLNEDKIDVKLSLVLDGTVPIPAVTEKVQEKVKSSIEIMTGNEVTAVDVLVSEVLL